MNESKYLISARIPHEFARDLKMMAEQSGRSLTDCVVDAIAAYLPHRKRPRSLDGLAKNLRRGEDGRYRWHWDPAFIEGPRTVNTGGAQVQDQLIEAARDLTMPALLVRGQQSELVSEAHVTAFREMVPHARFVDVSGAGHMVAGDRNDAFNDAVLAFLEGLEDQAPAITAP